MVYDVAPFYDPGDDESVRASATSAHEGNVGLGHDIERIGASIWRVARWPFQRAWSVARSARW